jgi:flagellar basal-body rod protein FlgF
VGTLRPTGSSLDLALANTGFFEVQTDTGPAYTRQGTFQVDGRGRLVTAQGQPVMGHAGEIVLTTPQPTIDGEGNVFENDRIVGRLKVTRFADDRALQRMGGGLVTAGSATPTVVDSGVGLRQGFLENSNVSTMQEMVGLMQTMRHFETMQRLAQGYDEMLSSAVRKLGDA